MFLRALIYNSITILLVACGAIPSWFLVLPVLAIVLMCADPPPTVQPADE